MRGILAPGKAKALEGLVEEIAGVIARKWPPRPVGPPQSRGQAHDEEPCAYWTEGSNGRIEPFWLTAAPIIPEGLEAGAERTIAGGLAGTSAVNLKLIHRSSLVPRL